MAVYSGNVSNKNGLGRLRPVVATDDNKFAQAFGITGNIGNSTSNGKVGMLQLEGAGGNHPVAVDTNEMNRIDDMSYIKQHSNAIVDFSALADFMEQTNGSELVTTLHRVAPNADFNSIDDKAREAVVKLYLGLVSVEDSKAIVSGEADNTVAIFNDVIKRNLEKVQYSTAGMAGGVDFEYQGHLNSDVQINLSAKQDRVKSVTIHFSFRGTANGSASQSKGQYKDQFKEVKSYVSSINDRLFNEKTVRVDKDDELDEVVENINAMSLLSLRKTIRKEVKATINKFADFGNFNPSSAKSRLWGELGITSTDVSQNGVPDDLLQEYNNQQISAIQVANDPTSGITEKLSKSVVKRLTSTDIGGITSKIVEAVRENGLNLKDGQLEVFISDTKKILESQVIPAFVNEIQETKNFQALYDEYSTPNTVWENRMIDKTVDRLNFDKYIGEESEENDMSLNDQLIVDKIRNQLTITFTNAAAEFLQNEGIEPNSKFDKSGQIIDQLAEEYSTLELKDFKDEYPKTDENNVDNNVQEYIKESYDSGYVQELMERTFDVETLLEDARDESINQFRTTQPFSNVEDDNYWRQILQQVPEKEIFSLASNFDDRVYAFVENYAPEYQDYISDDEKSDGN